MAESPVAFATLALFLAGIFPVLAVRMPARIAAVLPPIVLSYVAATALAVAGLWPAGEGVERLRGLLTQYLLPALIFLLLVRCDLRAVAGLGPRVLVAFASATASICLGFVAAWALWRIVLPSAGWQVLASVGAGWVGGAANLLAVSRAIGATSETVSLSLVTDTACYAVWVTLLFATVPFAGRFNRWARATEADTAAPAATTTTAVTTPGSVLVWLAVAFAAAMTAQAVAARLPASGVFNASSWSLLVATVLGLGVALTPLGRLPGGEATASALLALVVVAMGSQGSFAGLASAPAFILAGATVLAIHAAAMLAAARLFRLDLALCGVASLANIGGIASAPVLAAAHRPALAPVGVLLALVGYLVGTGAGLGLAWALPRVGPGLAEPAARAVNVAEPPADADPRLRATHWIARCRDAARALLSAEEVAAANRRLLAADGSVRDLAALPEAMPQGDVLTRIKSLASLPEGELVADRRPATAADRDRWTAALATDAIPATVAPRFALVTRRAPLRAFPTMERVRRPDGAADIDRFQESAFFPGTPVVAVHASADGRWSFVLGTTYAGWVETKLLAFGPRDMVLGYAERSTWIVVAARAAAAPIPGHGAGEAVALDMGAALPAAAGRSAGVVELPVPGRGGELTVVQAAVEPPEAIRDGPLPASRQCVLEQAFRFLGERYGWGHDHDARDCSGLVCEVYRSLGIVLPRNTRDQAVSPALDRTVVGSDWSRERRLAALGTLLPGDLVYAPRHVMMIVGHDDEGPWVIHDTHEGRLAGVPPEQSVSGVVVAPLARILASGGGPIVDAVTVLVRVLAPPAGDGG
jgi:uncharacterized membrane protein/cell wall-associated NlpC family hydrolase